MTTEQVLFIIQIEMFEPNQQRRHRSSSGTHSAYNGAHTHHGVPRLSGEQLHSVDVDGRKSHAYCQLTQHCE